MLPYPRKLQQIQLPQACLLANLYLPGHYATTTDQTGLYLGSSLPLLQ